MKMHHRAKLTAVQVRAMRGEHLPYANGYEALARKYGCGISTARDICTYRTRKKVLSIIPTLSRDAGEGAIVKGARP